MTARDDLARVICEASEHPASGPCRCGDVADAVMEWLTSDQGEAAARVMAANALRIALLNEDAKGERCEPCPIPQHINCVLTCPERDASRTRPGERPVRPVWTGVVAMTGDAQPGTPGSERGAVEALARLIFAAPARIAWNGGSERVIARYLIDHGVTLAADREPGLREAERGIRFRVEVACDGYAALTEGDVPEDWVGVTEGEEAYIAGARAAAEAIRAALERAR